MANENQGWGAPRIHGELLKLGIIICESTVQRYMPKKGKEKPVRIGRHFYRIIQKKSFR
jgi:hypothetical protein